MVGGSSGVQRRKNPLDNRVCNNYTFSYHNFLYVYTINAIYLAWIVSSAYHAVSSHPEDVCSARLKISELVRRCVVFGVFMLPVFVLPFAPKNSEVRPFKRDWYIYENLISSGWSLISVVSESGSWLELTCRSLSCQLLSKVHPTLTWWYLGPHLQATM